MERFLTSHLIKRRATFLQFFIVFEIECTKTAYEQIAKINLRSKLFILNSKKTGYKPTSKYESKNQP